MGEHALRVFGALGLLSVALTGALHFTSADAQLGANRVTFQSAAAATGNGNEPSTQGFATLGLQVTITGTATVTFESSNDNGSHYNAHTCVRPDYSTTASTATATNAFFCNVSGVDHFRARVSAFTSGTVSVVGNLIAGGTSTGGGAAGGAGTEFAEDTAHTTGDAGMMILCVRRDTNTALADTSGDYAPCIVDSNGNVKMVIASSLVSIGGGTQFAEDAAHTTGDTGTMMLCVRRDTNTTLADTSGDYVPCQVDSGGNVKMVIASSLVSIGGGTQHAEDAAHVSGDTGTMILCVRNDMATSQVGANNDYAPCQVDSSGMLRVTVASSLIGSTVDAANNAIIVGNVAHDAADSSNPVKIGARADDSLPGNTPVSAANDRTDLFAGLDGVLLVRPHAPIGDRVSGIAQATTLFLATAPVAAQGAGVRFCLTSFQFTNTSAANASAVILDGSTPIWGPLSIPAGGGNAQTLTVPLCSTANTAFGFHIGNAVSSIFGSYNGFKTNQ